ncbi:MAG: TonB-dependent receptor [Hyphomicrobium sp.]|nr:TonB-dependent receptor [Hyphomicrobium sp.]
MSNISHRRALPIAAALAISTAALVLFIREASAQEATKPAPETPAATQTPPPANPPAPPATTTAAPPPPAATTPAAPPAKEPALPEVKIIQDKPKPAPVQEASPTPKKKPAPLVEDIEPESVPAPKPKKKKVVASEPASKPKAKVTPQSAPAVTQSAAEQAQPAFDDAQANAAASGNPADRSGALTVPTTTEARAEIEHTPGAVDLVSDKEYKNSTPSSTIKDALDYVPGVFVQPKWGEDSRLSIRGSGLSRNFHLRGLQLYMDGIPINTSDGYGDFQEIDPSVYRYIEVYKGANALRYGANSLGGAINFVMPTGYDASAFGARLDVGSFGYHKLSASSGGVSGAADYFIAGTWQEQDGFREHSDGQSVRGAMNIGYRLSENIETRFYLNASSIEQRIPGSVTKDVALSAPQTPAAINVTNDWQRNIDSVRLANKTTVRVAPGTTVELGAFYTNRHLMHPIFMWLDHRFDDYGGFARLHDESTIDGHKNRLIAGVTVHNGKNDNIWYVNLPNAAKGPMAQRSDDISKNYSFYLEDSFYLTPNFAIVGGTQFLHAEREREAVLNRTSYERNFDLWSPKVGLLWETTPTSQIFANISRSAEVPTFDEDVGFFSGVADAKVQRGTTYEVGTRGRTEDFNWDLTLYRANLDNELMCMVPFGIMPDFCFVGNANKTIHQGVEAGLGAAIFKGILEKGDRPDKVWLNAAYTYNDFHFDNDPLFGNNDIPGAPKHFVRAELLYKHPSGVYFGPNVEWVPEAYFVDSANTLDTAAYAIWGMKLGYDDGKSWSAYIEGRNLSDQAYIASSGITNIANPAFTNLFEPGNGRAVYGGIQYKW